MFFKKKTCHFLDKRSLCLEEIIRRWEFQPWLPTIRATHSSRSKRLRRNTRLVISDERDTLKRFLCQLWSPINVFFYIEALKRNATLRNRIFSNRMVTLLVLSSHKLLIYHTPSKFSWQYITNWEDQIICGLSRNVEAASVFDGADRLKITRAYISSSLSEWEGGVIMHQPDVIYVFVSVWPRHCITVELRRPREGIFTEPSNKMNPPEKHVGRQGRRKDEVHQQMNEQLEEQHKQEKQTCASIKLGIQNGLGSALESYCDIIVFFKHMLPWRLPKCILLYDYLPTKGFLIQVN